MAEATQTAPPKASRSPYIETKREDGRLGIQFDYHPGQRKVMASRARTILLLAGTQSGKTIMGPFWMAREIARKGPGDYLVAAPSYPLLELKCLPAYKTLYERKLGFGTYVGGSGRAITLNARGENKLFGSPQPREDTRILFGHAQDPDSLESATIKAAHLDEAGQKKFKFGSYQAIERRLSIYEGRMLITTTPYYRGWLYNYVYKERDAEPGIEVIQFDSVENPAFPRAEYERQRKKLPGWKWRMMYRGQYERPAGLIYDNFSREDHVIDSFPVPEGWATRYLGLDFGGTNTAGVFLARQGTSERWILYREYEGGGKTAADHVDALTREEARTPARAMGGSGSEDQWRSEFTSAGLRVEEPPISDVEVGINRVYAMLAAQAGGRTDEPHLVVMDRCTETIDSLEGYQRELDDEDEPTEKIANKSAYHLLDALRYIASEIRHDEDLPDAPKGSTSRNLTL